MQHQFKIKSLNPHRMAQETGDWRSMSKGYSHTGCTSLTLKLSELESPKQQLSKLKTGAFIVPSFLFVFYLSLLVGAIRIWARSFPISLLICRSVICRYTQNWAFLISQVFLNPSTMIHLDKCHFVLYEQVLEIEGVLL